MLTRKCGPTVHDRNPITSYLSAQLQHTLALELPRLLTPDNLVIRGGLVEVVNFEATTVLLQLLTCVFAYTGKEKAVELPTVHHAKTAKNKKNSVAARGNWILQEVCDTLVQGWRIRKDG